MPGASCWGRPRDGGSVTARAPAKVNLVLKVGGLRPDGFHDLVTVFHAVGPDEEVTVADGPPGVLVRVRGEGAELVPLGEGNLAARAVRALADEVGVDLAARGVAVAITKRIPVAAGLAGGSGDAAAALVALDSLWATGLDRERMGALGATLGSDVPFALEGGTAVGTGRGEHLAPVLGRGRYHWVLAFSPAGLSTPRVFAELDRGRALDRVGVHPAPGVAGAGAGGVGPTVPPGVLAALRRGDAEALGAALDNDMQAPALRLVPALRECLDVGRERGALGGVVSGSGPTCAFLVRDPDHAADVAAALTAAGACRAVVQVTGPAAGASVLG